MRLGAEIPVIPEGQQRQVDTGKMEGWLTLGRQAFGSGDDLDHTRKNCLIYMIYRRNSDSAPFDFTLNCRVATGDQVVADVRHGHAIIPDQASELPRKMRFRDQSLGQCGFACAGGPQKQHALLADHNSGGVKIIAHIAPQSGSDTVKRAPARSPFASRIFSAWIFPACASTICCEIESPSPEFCPKPCSGRSV